jgi:hypothetical protein
MAERAPEGVVRHYPIGHFDIYKGAAFEQAVADQVAFFKSHLATANTPLAAER